MRAASRVRGVFGSAVVPVCSRHQPVLGRKADRGSTTDPPQNPRYHQTPTRRSRVPLYLALDVNEPLVPLSEKVRRQMQRDSRGRDTAPELALRRAAHRRGLRYRVDTAPLVGLRRRADLVFRSAQVAVFVDGCFWHGCAEHGSRPKHNARYWGSKIENNRRRDRETDDILGAAGWTVLRFWEHDDLERAADEIARVVRERRAAVALTVREPA